MLELIFVRHGETDGNKKNTYLGWTDLELNEDGIKQANRAKENLKDIKIDGIYSSPLKRTRKTAEIINENFNLDILYSDYLRERNFGIWDNLTFDEITKGYPDEYSKWINNWINYSIIEGESALDSYTRAVKFIDEVVSKKENGTFLIVTHLGTIRFLLSYLLGMKIEDSWRFRVNNCSITKVEINEGYAYLTKLNSNEV